MINHPELRLLVQAGRDDPSQTIWRFLNDDLPHVTIHRDGREGTKPADYDAVITVGSALQQVDEEALLRYVADGGGWLVLTQLSETPLPGEFGVQPAHVGPEAELRILFDDAEHPLSGRLPDAVYVAGRYHPLEITDAETETLLYADWHYSHTPVWTTRAHGRGHLACTTLQDFSSSMLLKLLHRLFRSWQGTAPAPGKRLNVGILGYAPSVGQPHGLAVKHVTGLQIRAICDRSPERLSQASRDFPETSLYDDSNRLAKDENLDLVIVATPPDLHAVHCQEMMAAGKHVLCEKPLALTSSETLEMMRTADQNGVHLSCHQNRRWDPDYLTIKTLVESGRIGELFHLETFVGGYHHPCGYWHSDSAVSGGTSFDWGAHYLDWIVSLIPEPVEAVMGSRHRRVWHDVTNADQERLLIRFTGGQEAEFLHSDIAAARKPKWYLLGTLGAILGEWRDISAYHADPIYYFQKSDIPATEMMPEITLHQRISSGEIELVTPKLPERQPYAFHANLVDHLLWAEPLAAPLADSVKVVAILEAAARSMANNSRWERIDDA